MNKISKKRHAAVTIAAIALATTSYAALAQDTNPDGPRNWQETLNVMNGKSAAGQAATTMHEQIQTARKADITDKTSDAYVSAEATLDNASNRHGVNAATLDAGYERDNDINTLQQQLNDASDDTDLAIVNAKAQLANSKMLNEMIKLQSSNGMFDSQRDMQTEEDVRAAAAHHDALHALNP